MALRLATAVLVSYVQGAAAAVFLKTRADSKLLVDHEFVQQSVAVALALTNLRDTEAELSPLFAALPKNEAGLLEASVVRYATTRYFSGKHAWQVVGLDEDAVDKVPGYMMSLFEERLQGRGFNLHELAVYVATISQLIRREVVIDLDGAYKMLNLQQASNLDSNDATKVLRAYLVSFLLKEYGFHQESYENMSAEVIEYYEAWSDLTMWADDVFSQVEWQQSCENPFSVQGSYQHVETVMHQIGAQYHTFQQGECEALKDVLVQNEYRGTGRILLKDYYAAGFNSNFRFWESPSYLRKLGALDETDPRHPAIIIPNFYTSRANCVGSSSFFYACCTNECDTLMSKLEQQLASPTVMPDRVVQVVSHLASDTVHAPRNLSATLVNRLHEIAHNHGGEVPLHGRLFAQWMHHAYPRECSQPHSGSSLSFDEFERQFGEDASLPLSNLQMLVRRQARVKHNKAEELPWSLEEELLSVHRASKRTQKNETWRIACGLIALISIVVPLARSFKTVREVSCDSSADKQVYV